MPPPHLTSPPFITLLTHTFLSGTFAFLALLYFNYVAQINPSRAAYLWPYLHYPIVVAGIWSKLTGYLALPFLVSIALWILGWALLLLGGSAMWLGRVVTWTGSWVEAGRVIATMEPKGKKECGTDASAGVRRTGKVEEKNDQQQVTGVEPKKKGAKKARRNMRVRKKLRRDPVAAAAEDDQKLARMLREQIRMGIMGDNDGIGDVHIGDEGTRVEHGEYEDSEDC